MRRLLLASLLCGCGALDVPPRGPLARYDLLVTSVSGDAVGDVTGFDSLLLLRPDGTIQEVVPGERGRLIRDAAWSPDGASIAYTAITTDPFAEVTQPGKYVARVEPGGLPRTLARLEGRDVWRPRWSPDGARLLATISVPDDTGGRGEHTRVIVLDASGGNGRLLPFEGGDATDPEWSADGRRVFFLAAQATEVWSVDTEGGAPELLRAGDPIGSVAVSPRGDALLLSITIGRSPFTVLVDAVTGEDLETIDLGWGTRYLYSPDGSQLAFLRKVDTGEDKTNLLFTYGARGILDGEARHLHECDETVSPGCSQVDETFSWTPDGRWLALSSKGKVYVVRASDGLEIEAPHGNRLDSNPLWRPP